MIELILGAFAIAYLVFGIVRIVQTDTPPPRTDLHPVIIIFLGTIALIFWPIVIRGINK